MTDVSAQCAEGGQDHRDFRTTRQGHPVFDNQNRRTLVQCNRPIQERMVWHLVMCEDELGCRVGEGLGVSAEVVRGLSPLQTQTLTEAELARAADLGKSGARDVSGLILTHCVPNANKVV